MGYIMLYKNGKRASAFKGVLFAKTITQIAFVGYEMITAISALSIISYPTRARSIIIKYLAQEAI